MSSIQARPLRLGLLLVGLIALPVRGDESENLSRLQSMPRDQRLVLMGNLERFERLTPEEQETIRRLDAKLATLDPADQSRYHAVLKKYHTWLLSLPKPDQDAIRGATSDADRMALVNKFRDRDREKRRQLGSAMQIKLLGLPLGELGAVPPFEMGALLRVWFALSPEEQVEINRIPAMAQRLNRLRQKGFAKNISTQRFPADKEREYLTRIQNDPIYIRDLLPYFERTNKKGEMIAAKKKLAAAQARPIQTAVESLYFAENPPANVDPARLAQFDGSLPDWLRQSFDSMTPEDARRYLTILYRQVYPAGTEIQPAKKTAPAPDPAKKVGPAPGASKSGNPGAATPF